MKWGVSMSKFSDTAECCTGLAGVCHNWECLHDDQHRGRRDGSRDLDRKGCTDWQWCNFIQAKVRCLMQNTIR